MSQYLHQYWGEVQLLWICSKPVLPPCKSSLCARGWLQMQLQGSSCRKQSSHPGACTRPPVGAPRHHHLAPEPFVNHFSVAIFHLDQGQHIINRTEKQQTAMWPPKGVGREREWAEPSSWEWWPSRSARTCFQENIWRQNFLVKALLTIPVVSQFIFFEAWNQNISHFFAGFCLAIALSALLPCSLCIQKQMLVSVGLLLFVLTKPY